jgi:hypothetical protein
MWPSLPIRRQSVQPVDVTTPWASDTAGQRRVTSLVDGTRVWFASNDRPLGAVSEAFGAAFLVPALHAGRTLRLEGDVCPTWAANLDPLTDAFRQLWYPDAPRPIAVPTAACSRAKGSHSARPVTALCFSGGVDAFHTLLTSEKPIDTLVSVIGYDVPIRDRARAAGVSALLHSVARQTGRQGVVITTNIRRHPLFKATPWLRAFGGPLAAIGHVMRDSVGRILLSSDGLGFEHPEAGSRPSTDPLHGSAQLTVDHVAANATRLEKIIRIAGEPVVQQHLRVCWKNVAGRLNCGRCEKCIRTMLALDACGNLGQFAGFDRGRQLAVALDGLAAVDGVVLPFYRTLLDHGLSVGASAAVKRLVERSQPTATGGSRSPPASSPPPRPRGSADHSRHRLLSPAAFREVCEPLVGKRVGYVRPEGNVGDQLIEVAMIQLFAEYGIRWTRWRPESPGDTDGLDLLAFGGGGNMGRRYANNHVLRGRALATRLPVVILPQSFTSPEVRPFARVFVREQASLHYRPDGILAPDLALGLATVHSGRPDRGLGVFLRRDQERGGRKPLLVRDPVRLRKDPFAYLALAARYERIVTDRLHFAVAGLHAGRDVTLVANDYHKNRSMHETWLADLGCRFVTTAAAALGRRAA